MGQLPLSICDTPHTQNVTQHSQVSTYVRRTDSPELDLENNTHYSLSLRMSRAAVPYYISPALHNKKIKNLGGN